MDSHRYELVETYARAMRQYNEDMQPYYAFQRGLDDARLRRATELIKDSDNWKDHAATSVCRSAHRSACCARLWATPPKQKLFIRHIRTGTQA